MTNGELTAREAERFFWDVIVVGTGMGGGMLGYQLARSGRKVLFVNPQFTLAIKDMDERESRLLLDTLFHQALIPEYQFRLHWAAHTIAMWDNRSTQHYAANDYYPERRCMERTAVVGDVPY